MNLLGKLLLSPFTLVYYLLTSLRNHLFDIGYTRSFNFETMVIGIGNLAMGGSGKTPMVEYIVELLLDNQIKPATLSRGYKRRTKGFRLASEKDSAVSIGDEPYQLYLKFGKNVAVAVGEERALAIPNILFERSEIQAVVLDDAFQHRYVNPQMNILLTECSKPFYQDQIIPWGRLRENRKGARRADAIVVTKCTENISEVEMSEMERNIRIYARKEVPVFFSQILYAAPQPVFVHNSIPFYNDVVLLTGIANNEPIKKYVGQKFRLLKTISFPDHHFYAPKDVYEIVDKYNSAEGDKKTLLTTEKDMVKLLNLQQKDILQEIPLYYLPIKVQFVKDGEIFDKMILDLFEGALTD